MPSVQSEVPKKLPPAVKMADLVEGQRVLGPKMKSLENRFWSKVEKRSPDECWPWIGYMDRDGYGKIRINFKTHPSTIWGAHRVAYLIHHGEIRNDLFCCHVCDQPSCCNWRHLFMGTNQENIRDASMKGRMANGARHVRAKLSSDQIIEMRMRYGEGSISTRKLASEFGIGKTEAHRIISHTAWRHIPLTHDRRPSDFY